MNIGNALKISGWMEEPELLWLAAEAQKHRRIVEIGSWLGRSTRALADNTSGCIFAVDTWAGSDEEGHRKLLAGKHPDWLYGQFLSNMHGLSNVFPVRRDSVIAATILKSFDLTDFDMVFIDGSHDFNSVMADIQAWQPLIRSGGIICGHDRGYPPVAQAVATLLGEVSGDTDIWVKQL